MRHFLFITAMLLATIFSINPAPLGAKSSGVTLTSDIDRMTPASEFDCRERIYAHFIADDLKKGPHQARAYWERPDGRLQHVSTHEFNSTSDESRSVNLWIELQPATGGAIFDSIDPSIGMGSFIGGWSVDIYIDGRPYLRDSFYVAC